MRAGACSVPEVVDEELPGVGPDSVAFLTSIEPRGLPLDWRVKLNYVEAEYSAGGAVLYSLRPARYITDDAGGGLLTHAWMLPEHAVQELRDTQPQLELNYSLTLLKPHEYQVPTDGKQHRLPGLGYCGAVVNGPGNRIDGKWTINQARGCSGRIADRFDLTIECVRRHYEGDTTHPLGDVLARYGEFFDLFGSFAGYVDFWLLDDLLDVDGGVKFFLASDDFTLPAVPRSREDYVAFRDRTIEFVTARNHRISQLQL